MLKVLKVVKVIKNMSQKVANLLFVSFNDARSNIPNYIRKELKNYDKVRLFVITNVERFDYEVDDVQMYYDSIFGKNKIEYSEMDYNILSSLDYHKGEIFEMYDRYRMYNRLSLYDKRVELYTKQVSFWYNYLVKNQITHVILGNIPHLGFDYVIYNLAKRLDIPTLLFYRIPVLPHRCVRFYVFEDLKEQLNNSFKAVTEDAKNKQIDSDIQNYLGLRGDNEVKTFHGRADDKGGKYTFKRIIRSVKYRINKFFIDKKRGKGVMSYFLVNSRKMKKYQPNYTLMKSILESNDFKYIFMPLHFQPEASSAPLGGAFADQAKILNTILNELPPDFKIVIKPHKLMGGHRQFFERFQDRESVLFVHSSESAWDLMKRSKAVLTISGTVGWEAVLNSIPVIIYGSIFYQNAPGVYKINSTKDLKSAISTILEGGKSSETQIQNYLKVLSKVTTKGWVDNRYGKLSGLSTDENLQNQTNEILKWIKKNE